MARDPYAKELCKGCTGSKQCFPCEGTGWIKAFTDEVGIWGKPGQRYPVKKCGTCEGTGNCICCKGKGWRHAYEQN